MAELLAHEIEARTGHETRSLVLGHLQRGGQPIAFDRLLALRFGSAAVDLVDQGEFGCMVALDPPNIVPVPLRDAVSELKYVPLDGDMIHTARHLGICLGDDVPSHPPPTVPRRPSQSLADSRPSGSST